MFEALTGVCRVSPYKVVLFLWVQEARQHLTVVYASGGYDIATDKAMVNIDADAVLVAVVTGAILFTQRASKSSAAIDLGYHPSHLAAFMP